MEYTYGQVERALARVFDLKFEDANAFRARLRHLRNLGVPSLVPTGSGRKATFTRNHAVEMLAALQFEALGVPPRRAAMLVESACNTLFSPRWKKEREGQDVIALILPGEEFSSEMRSTVAIGPHKDAYVETMLHKHQRLRIANLTRALEALDKELAGETR